MVSNEPGPPQIDLAIRQDLTAQLGGPDVITPAQAQVSYCWV
jgi:hypothetical protein